MNTKLLKLNNMKKFVYWLDINNVHPNTLDTFKHFQIVKSIRKF